jgi:hypothetical protein
VEQAELGAPDLIQREGTVGSSVAELHSSRKGVRSALMAIFSTDSTSIGASWLVA